MSRNRERGLWIAILVLFTFCGWGWGKYRADRWWEARETWKKALDSSPAFSGNTYTTPVEPEVSASDLSDSIDRIGALVNKRLELDQEALKITTDCNRVPSEEFKAKNCEKRNRAWRKKINALIAESSEKPYAIKNNTCARIENGIAKQIPCEEAFKEWQPRP